MLNKLKVAVLTAPSLFLAPSAHADTATGWTGAPAEDYGLAHDFDDLVITIIDWFLGFVVMLSVLVIVFSGITYVASSGDQERTTQAKKTAKYAIMGLAMSGVAYAVVRLVVTNLIQE